MLSPVGSLITCIWSCTLSWNLCFIQMSSIIWFPLKKKKMCLMSYWQEAAASYHCVQKTKLNKLHTERMKCSLKTILSNINFTPIWAVYSPAQSHVKVSLYLSRKLNILASRIVTLHPNEENTPLLSIEFKWISST